MRVRTGRFEELRLRRQPGDAQPVEVADREGDVDEKGGVSPPATGIHRDLCGAAFRKASGAELAVDRRSPLPLLEMHGSQAVADPFVQFGENAWGIGQAEVLLPP